MRGGANTTMLKHTAEDNEDIKQDILDQLSDVGEILHNRILVATFNRPEKTSGGIIVPIVTKKEDEYQGVVGIVVAKGPGAFVDAPGAQFHGKNVKRGDWVSYSVRSGRGIAVNGLHCRIIEDAHIDMILPRPDMVF